MYISHAINVRSRHSAENSPGSGLYIEFFFFFFFWGGGVENPSERTSEENCEGAKRPSGERVWEGVFPLPGQGKICIWSPKKQFSDAYFGGKLLEYDFLQIANGKDENIEF